MENRSFALDEERSTYTEGESKSRRSSILKPQKPRAPLHEVNLGGSADDTEDFDTLRKRRVSFAGVNSVKEFCSQAESLQVCHIQSYEETFSTSSDNSHSSSAAKSIQLGTPKNAVPLGEDHNFADDPMDLTDSTIDNNHVPNKFAPPFIRVLPVVTPSADLSESAVNNKANLHSWSGRKSVVISNPQSSVIDGNVAPSNKSISSVVGAPAQRTPRNPDPPVAMSSPWSCSMEITEPITVPRNGSSGVNGPSRQQQVPYPAYRNSTKLVEHSDSGMELTEAVRIRPFSINQANDDCGDMSMEMTEVVKKTELKTFRSQISFTNFTTNKSASINFTEVAQIRRKDGNSRNFQSSTAENSRGNSGMELTETVGRHYMRSDPSERVPLAQHIPSEKSHSVPPQVHHVTPFPHGPESMRDCEESMLQTSGNQSVSDMEMTGVLSLSKYNKLIPDNDDVEDMDFTQLMSVNGPTTKKARMSNEPEEEPFHIISPLTTKVAEKQRPSSQIKSLMSEQSIPASRPEEKIAINAEPLVTNADINIPGVNLVEDDDTFALNFKNNKQGNSPIELSILNDFRDSPPPEKPVGRESAGHNLTMTQSGDPFDHEHLLLYSPPKDTKPPCEVGGTTGFGRVSVPIETSNKRNTNGQPIPKFHLNSQDKRSINSFEAQVLNEPRNFEPSYVADPLRNFGNTCSFMNDESLQTRARVSFKDFEIKPDTVAANESLSTVGMDDSDILKAGLDDITCPERVPSICMSMTSHLISPCSKSRMSIADKTTFSNSVTQEVERKGEQPISANHLQLGFGGNSSSFGEHVNLLKTINRYDDQDTSVSVPFVFKSAVDKRNCETQKLSQSIPVIGFDESQSHQSHLPEEDTGLCLPNQRNQEGNTIFPLVRKSCGPNQLISSREANDQDTTVSMPFVFKAVADKSSSSARQLGQNFPVIEFGEAQSSAQMELTEVTPPDNIEPRKSLARLSFAPEGSSIQPSCSSGQMELTDVVAVNRKSVRSSHQIAAASPEDSSGIEMDETLMKLKSLKKDKVFDLYSEATESAEGAITMSNDMEETNVKPKDVKNQRNSFFPLDPLSLSSEETITKPNTSNVACVQHIRKSCVGIDNEDTFAKSSFISHVPSQDNISSGAPYIIDMEQTALNPQIRLSSVPKSRKSVFDPQTSPKGSTSTIEAIAKSSPNVDEVSTKDNISSGATNMIDMGQTELNPQVRLSLAPKDRKSFFNLQTTPKEGTLSDVSRSNKDALAKSSVGNACSDATSTMNVEQISSTPQVRKSFFDSQTLPKSTAVEEGLNSLRHQGSAAQHGTKETLQGDSGSAHDMADLDRNLSYGLDKPDAQTFTYVDRRSDFVSAVDEQHNYFPPSRLSSRKSVFEMTSEAQPEDEYCDVQINNVKKPEEATVETEENPSSDLDVIGESSERIVASSVPSVQKVLASEGENSAGMRMSRKSVRFNNKSEEEEVIEEPRVDTSQSVGQEMDVEQDGDGALKRMSINVYSEVQLNNNIHEPSEHPVLRRASRKSCIGVPLNMSTDAGEVCDPKPNSEVVSDEFEFAIRRNKRKSTIGTRQSENYPDIDPENPEDYFKLDVTPLDGQQYGSEMHTGPECNSVDEPQEVEKDIDLSKDMMNISLNEEELSESEMEKLHTTSTPCKPRASCTEASWDRKRNRSGTAKTPSSTSNLALDLSQEMMNISIQGDERSPLPKKLSSQPSRKLSAAKTPSLTAARDLSQKMINVPVESSTEPIQHAFLRSPLLKKLSIPPQMKPSTTYKDLNEECPSNRAQSRIRLALRESVYVFEDGRTPKPVLPYETRIENRDLMRRCGFKMMASQTNWETLLYDKVLGVKVVLPLCEFNEVTKIESIQYTFHHWRIGQTINLDRDTVEFIKNRIHRKMPEVWLREECSTVGDLNRVITSLKSDVSQLKSLINQLHYVKRRHPCTISNDSISFSVVNKDARAHFKVTIELKNSHKMSDCSIAVKNICGKVDLDTVRLVFSALPSNDDDVLYRFVRYLVKDTSNILVR